MPRKRCRITFSDYALSEFQDFADVNETLKAINEQVISKVSFDEVDISALVESQQNIANLLVNSICKMLNIKGKVNETTLKQYKEMHEVE